jgi:hypothetical protein
MESMRMGFFLNLKFITVSLWIYQEMKVRAKYGFLNRQIIDAKGFKAVLSWPMQKITDMCLPGLN